MRSIILICSQYILICNMSLKKLKQFTIKEKGSANTLAKKGYHIQRFVKEPVSIFFPV